MKRIFYKERSKKFLCKYLLYISEENKLVLNYCHIRFILFVFNGFIFICLVKPRLNLSNVTKIFKMILFKISIPPIHEIKFNQFNSIQYKKLLCQKLLFVPLHDFFLTFNIWGIQDKIVQLLKQSKNLAPKITSALQVH